MRELIDCHVHTAACGHATGTAAQMIGAGVFGGLTGIVLTEHLPLPDDLNHGFSFAPSAEAFAAYADEVRATAARVKGLSVVVGAEADWLPECPDSMAAQMSVARSAGVEVLLGSVHTIDGWPFDSPDHLDGWEQHGVDETWTTYFSLWCDAVASGAFDVMAHPDLPKKFGHRPSFDPRELYDAAASAAAEAGVAIEISTAGLRKPVGELYPGPELLSMFASRGVPATVGSDAHSPADVGSRIGEAFEAAAAAGYERVALPLGGGEMRWIEL